MKPDWDKLAEEFKDSEIVKVVDVDCTADGKTLCTHVGVRGYPTIKYYLADEPNKPQDYKGGRDYAGLKKFVESTFKPPCDVSTKKGCSADQLKVVDALAGKSGGDLAKYLTEKKALINQIKADRIVYENESKNKLKDFDQKEEAASMELIVATKVAEKAAGQKDEL
jgi:hypothetical protein